MKRLLKRISSLLLVPLLVAGGITAPTAPSAQAATTQDWGLVTDIDAGEQFSLVKMKDGTMSSFGYNHYGQLGNGNSSDYDTLPAPVVNLSEPVKISAGNSHSLAVMPDGTVWGFGSNHDKQLVNAAGFQKTPVQLPGLQDIADVSAGGKHSLALDKLGRVFAWGNNENGQLGDGTTVSKATPTQVTGLPPIISIVASLWSSFALDADGNLYAWGYNSYSLGDGTLTKRLSPVPINLPPVAQISNATSHTLALLKDGRVFGWGNNTYKQLLPVADISIKTPTEIPLQNVKAVEAGWNSSAVLFQDGTVSTWGDNQFGQAGQGGSTTEPITVPTQVPGLDSVIKLSAGQNFMMALKSDGTTRGWGKNEYAQTGATRYAPKGVPSQAYFMKVSGAAVSSSEVDLFYQGSDPEVVARYTVKSGVNPLYNGLNSPYRVAGLASGQTYTYEVYMYAAGSAYEIGRRTITVTTLIPKKLTAGEYHTVYLKGDRSISTFGFNGYGQLGDKLTSDRYWPYNFIGLSSTGAVDIAAGYGFTLAKKPDGTLWAWGQNHLGQLGNGTTTDSLTPVQINLTNINKIASKYHHVLTVQNNGTVYGWGRNNFGELGLGNFTNQSTPQLIPNLTNVSDVKMGFGHSLILKTDGTVWAMGRNDQGQLGNGTTKGSTVAVQVPGLTGVKAIAAGSLHNLALKTDGTVWAWGYNKNGQLGNGLAGTNELTPKKITTLTGVKEIAAGYGHSLALKTDGTVWGFGYNYNGQLGDGTRFNSAVPVQVQGITNASKLISGGINGYVELSDGSYRVWGGNSYGAYGDGTNNYSTTPVKMFSNAGLAIYAITDLPNSMYLAWKTVPAAGMTSPTASYKVYRDNTLIYQGTNLNMTDTGLTAFTPYTYKVEALDAAGSVIETKTVVSATAQQLSMTDGMDGMENDYFTEEFYPLNVTGLEY
ncbi:hypothetical protein OS242_05780 [Tumebacillus sp. DT12]|uniref:RCC1-like domain-containing protein n=1 Tax=Tumebacillus lacus TaxID=2995335 RepID=A0ABT3X3Z2_9BACL|nr:hypothetical protein [Tumebacillus lacus]MCX7569464.1 hypothetical protein [Tumebacillus lacus]